jgi:hypothetical protein
LFHGFIQFIPLLFLRHYQIEFSFKIDITCLITLEIQRVAISNPEQIGNKIGNNLKYFEIKNKGQKKLFFTHEQMLIEQFQHSFDKSKRQMSIRAICQKLDILLANVLKMN